MRGQYSKCNQFYMTYKLIRHFILLRFVWHLASIIYHFLEIPTC